MYGLVYDGSDEGVRDAGIFVDNELIVYTDVQGRFILQFSHTRGLHTIEVKKDGYESIKENFSYDTMGLLHFKMYGREELLLRAESFLESGEYVLASEYAERASSVSCLDDSLLLQSIISYKQKKYAVALQFAENLLSDESYIEEFKARLRKLIGGSK